MVNEYTLKFTVEAEEDLLTIFGYINGNLSSPIAAEKLILKIEKACMQLVSFPFSGSIPKDAYLSRKGYRMILVDNFIIFYLIDDTLIKIMRIIYGKRNYSDFLK